MPARGGGLEGGRRRRGCGNLVEAALAVVPKVEDQDPRKDEQAALFLFEYVDGFRGAQLMLTSVSRTRWP